MASWEKIARRIRVPLGFAFAVAYFWLAKPTPVALSAGAMFVVSGLLIRAFASGHVTKNEQLTMSGPYAYTRNPLYLGSLVLASGFILASRSVWVGLMALALFIAIYVPVIRSEETFLRSQFSVFDEYARNVPRLIPRLTPYGTKRSSFSWQLYWKHREYNALLGSAGIVAVLLGKMYFWPH